MDEKDLNAVINELEQVKKDLIERLSRYGYDGEALAADIIEISACYDGRPSRVKLADGTEMYLF